MFHIGANSKINYLAILRPLDEIFSENEERETLKAKKIFELRRRICTNITVWSVKSRFKQLLARRTIGFLWSSKLFTHFVNSVIDLSSKQNRFGLFVQRNRNFISFLINEVFSFVVDCRRLFFLCAIKS